MWRATKTKMDPNARVSISQISIVVNSLFLGHDSTHLLEVKGCDWIRALAPTTGCDRILCIGDSFHMIHARQHADGMWALE